MSTPKKHHFVPQFLLRGFADDRESLVVHGLDPATRYVSTVRDVGHENDGHTLFRRDGTADRETLEAAMSQIEGDAANTVRELSEGEELTDERKSALSWFIAMQWHRSRYLLDSVASELPSDSLTREEVQTSLLRVVFLPFFSAWRSRNDMSVRPKDRWDSIESELHSFHWTLCRWLLENELVDEINLLTVPVVVGQGTRLFPDAGSDIALDLVESRTFPKGIALQVYRPIGRPQYAT